MKPLYDEKGNEIHVGDTVKFFRYGLNCIGTVQKVFNHAKYLSIKGFTYYPQADDVRVVIRRKKCEK